MIHSTPRTTFLFMLKLGVSVSIFVVLFVTFDLADVWSRLEIHSYIHLVLSLLTFLILLMNNALRWYVVLHAINRPASFILAFRLQYIAAFFNQALPSVIGGDAIRIYLLRQSGIALQTAVNSVALERIAALAGLIFLVTALQSFILPRADTTYVRHIFPALSVLTVGGIIALMLLDNLSRNLPFNLSRWRVITALALTAKDAKRVFLSSVGGVLATGLGLSGAGLASLIALFGAHALGINLSTLDALVLVPPAILASILPISIAGWGVREGAMVASLTYAGITEVDAIVISILFGLTMVIASMPGGILWVTDKRQKAARINHPDPHADGAGFTRGKQP